MTRRHVPPVSAVSLCIRRTVKANPGIHFRGLGRAAGVTSAGQLRHHLDHLERQGVLIELEDGRYKRFFVAGDQDPKLRPEMARFTRTVPRRIAKLLLVSPMNRSQLRRSLGCADSTLGYHLSRMVTVGDLARERGRSTCVYSLTNGETVRQVLLKQREAAAAALEAAQSSLVGEASAAAEGAGQAAEPQVLRHSRPPAPAGPDPPAPPSPDPAPPWLPEPVPDLFDPGDVGRGDPTF